MTSFVDRLMEDETVKGSGVSKEELEVLCNPANYIGLSKEMTQKVIHGNGGA